MNRWLPIPATGDLAAWGFASLADAILKATCLLVIAMIATCLLRRRGAAVRHRSVPCSVSDRTRHRARADPQSLA